MNQAIQEHILWSCVARDQTILAEATSLSLDFDEEGVATTARELLHRRPTPGFEFHTQRGNPLKKRDRYKGVKFHLYDNDEDLGQIVWIFAAVYDGHFLTKSQVQSFLEKIVAITEPFREDMAWRHGGTLVAQTTFAPILLQRMEEVTYLGDMALLEERLEVTRSMMQNNIELILEREEKLEALRDQSSQLNEMAQVFKKRSKKLRRFKMWQDAKHGLLIGTAITGAVAVIVVPPLVAVLA